jgi:hypothetical protein
MINEGGCAGGQEGGHEGFNIGEEPVFDNELTQPKQAQSRWQSKKTGAYTIDEDKLLCEACMKIVQDPILGGGQKRRSIMKEDLGLTISE